MKVLRNFYVFVRIQQELVEKWVWLLRNGTETGTLHLLF